MDRKRIDSSGRTLLIAFGVVAGAFILSTFLAERSDVRIRQAAAQIAENSAPSIEHLSLLRADLRRITLLGDDDLDTPPAGSPRLDRPRIEAALVSLEQDWAKYQALPKFAGEAALSSVGERATRDVAAAVAHVQTLDPGAPGGDEKLREVLEKELQPAANRLDAAALRLIDVNAAHGGNLGSSIRRLGEQSVTNAIVLDAICLALTVIAALLAWRLGRRYTLLLEQRADELEAFAGRVAHDVVGPLSAASLALDLLARGKASPERAGRAIEAGRAGISRARLIADGLLAFARAGARPEPGARAEVAEVVAGAFKDVAADTAERGIALVAEVEGVRAVACNQGVLASLISNLVRNAIKYGARNPSPRIVVRSFDVQGRRGERVRIEVEDNGPGLPPELGARAFEPYVRGQQSGQPGIGLGLATVKRIAVAHGGEASVRSVPGRGCTFSVELPAARGPVSEPPRLRVGDTAGEGSDPLDRDPRTGPAPPAMRS